MFKKIFALIFAAAGLVGAATAAQPMDALVGVLKKSMPGLNIDSIKETPMKGIFEIVSGGDVAYVSGDGQHMIQGTLFNVPKRKNLSDETLQKVRLKALAGIDESALIVYPAKGKALHTITVFTDPSCPYCHRLHDELAQLNELGVTVKYALYARNGGGTLTGRQLQEALCSTDPKASVDGFFKNSQRPTEGGDCSQVAALDKIAATARLVGLQGTPHIVTDTGLSFSGYRPPQEMLKLLERGAL
ncbi:DsbC family protein [Simplicispira suum]|uniref:Thiol:disulfide interchange protein n=1 Tax=Simplicispira suum TaxID=2109915 RepID=A0A2S0N5M3_9BURK|nr:DsbC family protein [Simplicispira suum]AVO43448.1 hypothetical protein C6571_18655 [Simplicispira suum]